MLLKNWSETMYILLSSSTRERYRHDVLRALSAPIGAKIQFRYSDDIVESAILGDNGISHCENSQGLVCHANLQEQGAASLIPVRFVCIERAFSLGSTVVLRLIAQDFVKSDSENFKRETKEKSNWQTNIPRRDGGKVKGNFMFDIEEVPSSIRKTRKVADWEKTVDAVHKRGSLEEKLYWTVLGVQEKIESEIEDFREWTGDVKVGENYKISVYIYSPERDEDGDVDTSLHFASSVEIESQTPRDLVIDSPYDLRIWDIKIPFRTLPSGGRGWIDSRRGWIQIGPKAHNIQTGQFEWQIDLNLKYSPKMSIVVSVFIVVATLVALPLFLNMWDQEQMGIIETGIRLVLSIVVGIVAGVAALSIPEIVRQ